MILSASVNSLLTGTAKTYCKLSSINIAAFSAGIMASSLYSSPSLTAAGYTQQFHSVLSSILEKHAPFKTNCCQSNPKKSFISHEILEQKSERSRLESIFSTHKLNPPKQ